MPNEHGQVTEEDCKAPSGQFRIIKEDMEDGDLEIVADYYHPQGRAEKAVKALREEDENNVYTLWNDKGEEVV